MHDLYSEEPGVRVILLSPTIYLVSVKAIDLLKHSAIAGKSLKPMYSITCSWVSLSQLTGIDYIERVYDYIIMTLSSTFVPPLTTAHNNTGSGT